MARSVQVLTQCWRRWASRHASPAADRAPKSPAGCWALLSCLSPVRSGESASFGTPRKCRLKPLPLELDAERGLVRLRGSAEFCVVIEVEPRGVAETERRRGAGVGAVAALADALHGDALRPQADGHVAEVLRDVVDELSICRQIENFLVE